MHTLIFLLGLLAAIATVIFAAVILGVLVAHVTTSGPLGMLCMLIFPFTVLHLVDRGLSHSLNKKGQPA